MGKLVISYLYDCPQATEEQNKSQPCFVCKGIGHRVGDCAQASEQQKKDQAFYNCNSPGHKGINQSKDGFSSGN